MLKKFVPHFFTLLNLLSGCVAAVLAVQNHLVFAAVFVGVGIFFDFFDGFFARMLKVPSELGLQLDSLADMITSGLVPGIVMMQLISQSLGGNAGIFVYDWETHPMFHFDFPPLALLGLLITLASAYRLAKFNIDKRQSSSFVGLPTPANAIMIVSLPLIAAYQAFPRILALIFNPWFLVGLTFLSTALLNAELPLFGLKFKSWDFKTNWYRYLLIGIAVFSFFFFQFLALPLLILFYVLFSATLHFYHLE